MVRIQPWIFIFQTVAVVLLMFGLSGCVSADHDFAWSPADSFSQSVIHRENDYAMSRAKLANYRNPDMSWKSVPSSQPTNDAIELTDQSDLNDYLAYAAIHNPGLEAAFYRWKASLERIEQAGVLPDPRFTYKYFIREVETRVGPQNQGISLSQTFPWLGKLSLRKDIASQQARMVKSQYDAVKLKLFHEVKDVYYEYYYLGQAIALAREHRDLMKYLEGVALVRYKVGSAKQSEVIRAQVELGKLEDTLRSLTDLRRPVVARLNSALNRTTHQDIAFPTTVSHNSLDADDQQIIAWLGESNPELLSLDHNITKQKQSISLARKNYYPDISLGLDYTEVGSSSRASPAGFSSPAALRSISRIAGGMGDAIDLFSIGKSFTPGSRPDDAGKDVWMLSLSMNLPIWRNKYAAGVRESRAAFIAAIADRKQLENQLTSRAAMVLYRLRDADRKIDLYKNALIPKARQSLAATETSYRAGSSSFLDLVDAQRVLLEFELSFERALADHAQRLAELEMLVGRDIPTTKKSKINPQVNND